MTMEKETLEMSFDPLGDDANLWKIVGRPLGDQGPSDGRGQGRQSLRIADSLMVNHLFRDIWQFMWTTS